jgi:hypothetical protein
MKKRSEKLCLAQRRQGNVKPEKTRNAKSEIRKTNPNDQQAQNSNYFLLSEGGSYHHRQYTENEERSEEFHLSIFFLPLPNLPDG